MRSLNIISRSIGRFLLIATCFCAAHKVAAQDGWAHAGFLYDHFDTTLPNGTRTEAVGPLYYCQKTDDDSITAVPPLFSYYRNDAVENIEYDFLYPLLTYEHYGAQWRWQFFELLSFAGGKEPDDNLTHRFTLFPFYFQERSLDTNRNYTAVVPFYGHLKSRLFEDKIFFVMLPAYVQVQKKDVITDHYFFPFVHVRNGDGLHGWQVFPFVGNERKVITLDTNGFGDVSTNAGHHAYFALWPLWWSQNKDIGTDDPVKFRASLPAFVVTRSPLRDSTTVFWPFFTWLDDRGRKYHEWEGPWPFVVFARGEGKTTSRVFPIFSQSHNASTESDSYAWPFYQYHWLHSDPLDRRSTRVVFYLYVGIDEKNTETGIVKKRRDMWPFFTWRQGFDGNTRLQIFAPVESVLAENRGIQRNWSPLWSLWRSEKNPRAGRSSESLLWNLYRHETGPDEKKTSLLFGLFQYQRAGAGHHVRLFYIPVGHSHRN